MANYINFSIKKENHMHFKVHFKSNSNNNTGIAPASD